MLLIYPCEDITEGCFSTLHQIIHQNCLMLVPSKEDTPSDPTQLSAVAAIILNACMGTLIDEVEDDDSHDDESALETFTPFFVTQQADDKILHVWLNGEFCTQLYTQTKMRATKSPPE